jgi:5-methylcytosine-specific restriction enzyme A
VPGWEGSTRRERLPGNWKQLRSAVLKRAGDRCQAIEHDGSRCPERATDVDHIRPGDDHALANLQALCSWHHGRKSGQEGGRSRKWISKKRPAERHPGLI